MPKITPFHARVEPLNQTGIWKNWSGYLVCPNYQYSVVTEYYSIRNAAAILDTTPLFKYRIQGAQAEDLLGYVLARDTRKCNTGTAQYSVLCNAAGFVIQDCVVLHVNNQEYWLTTAEPSLRYFREWARQLNLTSVSIEDISSDYGIVAVQGPHSLNVISQLTSGAESLRFFEVLQTEIEMIPVTISRTGFTGDLGYEIWVPVQHALRLWDMLMSAGCGYNLTPIGTTALKMARVEAGLLLMGVDFHSARYAWVPEQTESPFELGWGWMLRTLADDDREFLGRNALRSELLSQSSRWKTVGLEVDWHDFERLHREAGVPTAKHEIYRESTMSIYRRGTIEWDYVGYASSFLFSPILQKPIALAKLPFDLATAGTEIDLEITILRRPVNVLARVASLPFFNPPRKTQIITGNRLQ